MASHENLRMAAENQKIAARLSASARNILDYAPRETPLRRQSLLNEAARLQNKAAAFHWGARMLMGLE